jgi:hypothetical protein
MRRVAASVGAGHADHGSADMIGRGASQAPRGHALAQGAEHGPDVGDGTRSRPPLRLGQTTTAQGAEPQPRHGVAGCEFPFEGRPDLRADGLMFVDDRRVSANIARRCGGRPRMGAPYGPWATTARITGLRGSGVVLPVVVDSLFNRVSFSVSAGQALVAEGEVGRHEGLAMPVTRSLPVRTARGQRSLAPTP